MHDNAYDKFTAADTIYKQRNPYQLGPANNLKSWADFLRETDQHELALQKYIQAHLLSVPPNTSQCSVHLGELGTALEKHGSDGRSIGEDY